MNFETIYPGVSFGVITKGNNIIKMEPKSGVNRHKLNSNELSIFVLSGSVRVEVNEVSSILGPFEFIKILKGSCYSYCNDGKKIAVLNVTRT
jgi:glyoxylate utilization-related uncharacterized protein